MRNSFFKTTLFSNFRKTPVQRGLCALAAAKRFVQVSDEHFTAWTAILSDASAHGKGDLCHTLEKHDLVCTYDSDQIVIGSPKFSLSSRVFRILTLPIRLTMFREL